MIHQHAARISIEDEFSVPTRKHRSGRDDACELPGGDIAVVEIMNSDDSDASVNNKVCPVFVIQYVETDSITVQSKRQQRCLLSAVARQLHCSYG
jgi:hypothetical protein